MSDLARPPINELVLDVQFKPIESLTSLWLHEIHQLFVKDYPFYDEKEPLQEEIERFGDPENFRFNYSPDTPLRRQWYINKTNNQLFQFQHNRFVHNWRKLDATDNSKNEVYPRFKNVYPEFQKYLVQLSDFVKHRFNTALFMTQWEITKFNFIPLSTENWSKDLNSIFTFAQDLDFGAGLQSERIAFSKTSLIMDDAKPVGRIYTNMDVVGYKKAHKAAVFKISARGAPVQGSIEACFKRIETSNDLINSVFDICTTSDARRRWE